ncbi:hypothetical protein I4U23_007756 [Adineta vaga]|nr:hypothetical protein I4U23_007756 [Adineta vaga]
MAYVLGQPQYIIAQPQHQGTIIVDPFNQLEHEWSSDLCNCCDNMSQCCYAYFCWYCFLGSLAHKIKESSVSCCFVPNVLAVYRMKIRSILKIRGSACNDCCVVCWCPFCAGVQMVNELHNRGLA